ncbi:MAG: TerB family tellurite resistance protein [Flavobacteriales bacterium]|nr:TerB family tellurite resistance protein [Flavobacteriales bacterium]
MNDPFAKMEYNKKSLLALFVQLAKADNRIDENEIEFIEQVRTKLGVEKEVLANIWINDDQYPLNVPQSEKHRMTILHQLLILMHIDGDVAVEEIQFVRHIGRSLRISNALVEELISTVKALEGEQLSVEDILKSIQKFLN